MEPFSITCTTCQARLRVRDASAIGQILACPKCGSMVMVQPPPGYDVPPPPAATPSGATPLSATPPSATPRNATPPEIPPQKTRNSATPDPASPPPTAETARPPRKFKFKQESTATGHAPMSGASAGLRGPQPASSPLNEPIAHDAPGTPVEADERDDREAVRHRPSWVQWTLVGVAALFGIGLALLVVILVASKWNRGREEATVPVAEVGKGNVPAKSDTPSTATPSAEPPTVVEPKPADPGEPIASEGPPITPPPADGAATPAVPADSSTDESQEPAVTDTPPEDPAMPDAAPDPGVEAAIDPPGLPAEAAPEMPPADATPATEAEMAVADPNSPLAVAVAGAEFDGVALLDFLQFFAEFTAIPVTVHFDALRHAGLSPDSQVNLQLDAASAGQLLQNALDPVGLTYTFANGQIVIGPATDVDKEIESRSYDVSDLAETPEQTTALAMLIQVTIEPGTWQEAGGVGVLTLGDQSLEIEQSPAVQFEVARLLDRLRTARGLLPRSDIAREWLTNVPVFATLDQILQDKRITLNFSDPVALTTILDRLQNETEVRLLVDWESTRDADWRPNSPATLSATDTTVDQLLDTWLTPKQLGYQIVDEQVIQISSLTALTARCEVDVYRLTVNAAKTVDAIVPELKQALGEAAVSAAGGAFAFEPTSGCLVTRLPQPLQRQAYRWLSAHGHLEPTP